MLRAAALVCLAFASSLAGAAEVARLRWRGVTVEGKGPARLEAATEAHLALALRQLGVILVPAAPFDAEGAATCNFVAAQHAQCEASVVAGDLRAQRRAEVPFRDVEDLAESLALLVSGMIQTEIAGGLTPIEPEPVEPPRPPPLTPQQRREIEKQIEKEQKEREREKEEQRRAAAVRKRPAVPSKVMIGVGAVAGFGVTGDPILYGATLRAVFARAILRAGGSLSLIGASRAAGGYELSFLRLVLAPRVGVGWERGRVGFELSGGPGLWLLHTDARVDTNTTTSLGFVSGARLGVWLASSVALELGLDAIVSLTDARIQSGGGTLAAFGRFALDLSLAIVYRP